MTNIDVNEVENDVMEEHEAPENEKAREMLDRLSREMLWMSAQELYIKGILLEIQYLQSNWEDWKSMELLLKYLKELDNICGFSKDKKDVVIRSALKSSVDLFNSTKI